MYGETSGMLRDALGELLRQHRIQHRIGGPGLHTVPETTTIAERAAIGERIARYRHSVLTWCHQAMRATSPDNRSDPAGELRYRLDRTLAGVQVPLPTLDELTTEQRFPMVDLWRQAARACALGEHDFDAGVGYGRLSRAQSLTVVHDAADVVRALVSLDRRYAGIPDWQALTEPGRLGRAAATCATWSGNREPDYTVDRRGWRPTPTLVEEPPAPGVEGVLQAQRNLLIHLIKFPDAQSLRVVLDSQRIVSLETAARIARGEDPQAARWNRRAETYERLVHQTRDLGGLYGKGGPAAGQGALAAMRAEKLPADALAEPDPVRRLTRISAGIDERICTAIELGINERLYFHRVDIPAIENDHGELVTPPRREWQPVTGTVRTDLIATLRGDLRPIPIQRQPPKGTAQSRHDFEIALTHRPPPRGASPDVPSI
ncbi:hypothetical protein GCM10027062_30720 [Nocardioides hungaricus]